MSELCLLCRKAVDSFDPALPVLQCRQKELRLPNVYCHGRCFRERVRECPEVVEDADEPGVITQTPAPPAPAPIFLLQHDDDRQRPARLLVSLGVQPT